MALDIIRTSAELTGRLHPATHAAIVSLLRVTNSYYSNLIEGHNTHPADIERAMNKDYSNNPAKRALQVEGQIHIELQKVIENQLEHENPRITSPEFIQSIHGRFYERMPRELKIVGDGKSGEKIEIVPGGFRQREVAVGRHIAPLHDTVPDFLNRFDEAYCPDKLHGTEKVIAAAASHHRLGWIHPFIDGNGRVMRLFTDAYMLRTPVRGYGLWTISRGLARYRDDYMAALTWADSPRQGDLDGRGVLSLDGLFRFCRFFLTICLDQISFMDSLLTLDGLLERIKGYVELRQKNMIPGEKKLKQEGAYLLQEAALRGEFRRGEASRITGLPERTARVVLGALVKEGLLVSNTSKGPVRLHIPTRVAPYWLPDLFPAARTNSSGTTK